MNRTATVTVTPSHGPGPGLGPAPLGDSPEAQAGPGERGTEEGTGRESKEEEKKGQPSPL